MNILIREIEEKDLDHVVEFSINAWEPVFISMKNVLGNDLFEVLRPNWRQEQTRLIRSTCQCKSKYATFVAEADQKVTGFVTLILNRDTLIGEIHLLAVNPDFQNLNIGTELTLFALDYMKKNGMTLAEVATGGDPGHASARRAYEKAGFTPLPLVRYYKKLDEA